MEFPEEPEEKDDAKTSQETLEFLIKRATSQGLMAA
jgi:hypothetical protein